LALHRNYRYHNIVSRAPPVCLERSASGLLSRLLVRAVCRVDSFCERSVGSTPSASGLSGRESDSKSEKKGMLGNNSHRGQDVQRVLSRAMHVILREVSRADCAIRERCDGNEVMSNDGNRSVGDVTVSIYWKLLLPKSASVSRVSPYSRQSFAWSHLDKIENIGHP
jgi:hypothetical protein